MSDDEKVAPSLPQMPGLTMTPANAAKQSGCTQCDKSGFALCLCQGENNDDAKLNKPAGWDPDIDDPLKLSPKPLLKDDPEKLQFAEQVKGQFDTFMQQVASKEGRSLPELKLEGNRCELDQYGVQLSIPSPQLRAQFFDSLQMTGIAKPEGALMAGATAGTGVGTAAGVGGAAAEVGQEALCGYKTPTPLSMGLKPPGLGDS